jgi:hypothetical protein
MLVLLFSLVSSQAILLSAWNKTECDTYDRTAKPDIIYYFLEAFNTTYPAVYSYYRTAAPLKTCGFGRKGAETVITDDQCCHVGRHPLLSIRAASYGRINYSDPQSISVQMPAAANNNKYCNIKAWNTRSLFSWLEMSISPGVCAEYMKCSDAGDKLELYNFRNCSGALRGILNVTSTPVNTSIGLGPVSLSSVTITGGLGQYRFTDQVPNQPYTNPEISTGVEWFTVFYMSFSNLLLLYAFVRFGIKFWQKKSFYLGTCFTALSLLLVNAGFVWRYLLLVYPQTQQEIDDFNFRLGIQGITLALPTLLIVMQSVHGGIY